MASTELSAPINSTTMEGSDDELLELMRAIQKLLDTEATQLEEWLLNSILCDCPRCWDLYYARLREVHQRDANLQDHREWREAEEAIERFSPEIEEE